MDQYNIFYCNQFSYSYFKKIPYEAGAKNRKRGSPRLLSQFITFDIETTGLKEIKNAVMYVWQLAVNANTVIVGRTWKDFLFTYNHIIQNVPDNCKLICYVHNLSYEFAFFRELLKWEKMLILRSHSILTCETDKLIFRCSYMLTGKSLDKFIKDMGKDIPVKLKEVFDYEKLRFHNSRLKRFEWLYAIRDVCSMWIALDRFIHGRGYTLYSISLTSTGFVRSRLKEKIKRELPHDYAKIRALDTEEKYHYARNAFRGGNTHANRFYCKDILKNVSSYDIKSSYPAQMFKRGYPVTAFSRPDYYYVDELNDIIRRGKSCMIIKCAFENMVLKNQFEKVPYLSLHKIIKPRKFVLDNGRVMSAGSGIFYCTEIDWEIITKQYDFEIDYIKAMGARRGYLPQTYIDVVIEYFKQKEDNAGDEVEYKLAKGLLNSIYGCMVTDILRPNIEYKHGLFVPKKIDIEKELQKNAYINPLLYQFGVYITALARKQLQDGLDAIDDFDFVYCDTDSIKMINGDKYKKYFVDYNKDNYKFMQDRGGVYNNKCLGNWEYEGVADRFCTLGAKKYVYETGGKLKITIAGVNKKTGPAELGKIENFKPGFIFKNSGGAEARYNDKFGSYKYKGLELDIIENMYIERHAYKLDLSMDYKKLIEKIKRGQTADILIFEEA